jgi:hypothetical protein
LIRLIALSGNHIGTFWPQLMALLTQSVRTHMPLQVRLQGLQGWRDFVQELANEAPAQLVAVVDQATHAYHLEPRSLLMKAYFDVDSFNCVFQIRPHSHQFIC